MTPLMINSVECANCMHTIAGLRALSCLSHIYDSSTIVQFKSYFIISYSSNICYKHSLSLFFHLSQPWKLNWFVIALIYYVIITLNGVVYIPALCKLKN